MMAEQIFLLHFDHKDASQLVDWGASPTTNEALEILRKLPLPERIHHMNDAHCFAMTGRRLPAYQP